MDDVFPVFSFKLKQTSTNSCKKCISILSKHPRLEILIKTICSLKYKISIWPSIDDAVLYTVIGQILSTMAGNSIIRRFLKKFNIIKRHVPGCETGTVAYMWELINHNFISDLKKGV
jgi:hypothetical protein